MNRESALSALQRINAKVYACTQKEVSPEVVECLETELEKLFEAVQDDAYALDQMNILGVFVRGGFLGGTSEWMTFRQSIQGSVKTLYSYISRLPDSNQ